jgi:MFS family permease
MMGTPRTGWLTVGLLFLAQVLNYFDKTVLGIAATAIMTELGLTPRDYGLVASAFFSLYAVTGVAVAFIAAPRVRPRIIMAALLLVWSIAQLPIVFAASFTTLIGCRILLGMGEGAGTPTAVNACHEWFSPRERAIPTTLILFGSQADSLLAAPALSYLIVGFGWRSAFLACGIGGFALFVLWVLLSRDGTEAIGAPGTAPVSVAASGVRQRDLWRDGTVIGNLIAGFGAYWIVGFFVSWLPVLLHQRLALGTVAGGWVLSTGYALQGRHSARDRFHRPSSDAPRRPIADRFELDHQWGADRQRGCLPARDGLPRSASVGGLGDARLCAALIDLHSRLDDDRRDLPGRTA